MDYRNCLVGVYHLFTVLDSPYKNGAKTQKEKCQYCGKDVEYFFSSDGKMMEERQYFLDHIRAFAQPIKEDPGMMAAFLVCNPKAAARLEADKKANKRSAEFQGEMTEMFRWAAKRALNDEGWKHKKGGVDYSSNEK